jgi:hypothetical protein
VTPLPAANGDDGSAAAVHVPSPPTAEDEGESEREEVPRRGTLAVQRARMRLAEEVAARREALAAADLRAEAGLRYWLARQRWLWRKRELPTEQVRGLRWRSERVWGMGMRSVHVREGERVWGEGWSRLECSAGLAWAQHLLPSAPNHLTFSQLGLWPASGTDASSCWR